MRTSKEQREANAKHWHQIFMHGVSSKSAIVVQRMQSKSNPNMNRCRFLAVPTAIGFADPVVIAESATHGIDGCFMELVGFLYPGPQVTYYETGFNDWLKKTLHFEITYRDGLVFMLERVEGC